MLGAQYFILNTEAGLKSIMIILMVQQEGVWTNMTLNASLLGYHEYWTLERFALCLDCLPQMCEIIMPLWKKGRLNCSSVYIHIDKPLKLWIPSMEYVWLGVYPLMDLVPVSPTLPYHTLAWSCDLIILLTLNFFVTSFIIPKLMRKWKMYIRPLRHFTLVKSVITVRSKKNKRGNMFRALIPLHHFCAYA